MNLKFKDFLADIDLIRNAIDKAIIELFNSHTIDTIFVNDDAGLLVSNNEGAFIVNNISKETIDGVSVIYLFCGVGITICLNDCSTDDMNAVYEHLYYSLGNLEVYESEPVMTYKYNVRDKEAGNVIDTFNSYNEAEKALANYNETDMLDGIFVEDFYEITKTINDDNSTTIKSY